MATMNVAGTSQPTFFTQFPMQKVNSTSLDDVLSGEAAPRVTILFLWGLNCPNCDIAKAAILRTPDRFLWPTVRWLQCNVYDDFPMASRFGLHGAPTFVVYRDRRSRGRITGWPGGEAFVRAIEQQIAV